MGERGNVAVIVVVIFTATIIMFLFPLMNMAKQKDQTTKLAAQEAITNSVNEIRKKGEITQEDIDSLYSTLASTGEAYKVEFIVAKRDDNPTKKISGTSAANKGDVYVYMYTTQVESSLPLKLSEGDIVTEKAYIVSNSIYDNLVNWVYKLTGKDSYNLVAQDSGMAAK